MGRAEAMYVVPTLATHPKRLVCLSVHPIVLFAGSKPSGPLNSPRRRNGACGIAAHTFTTKPHADSPLSSGIQWRKPTHTAFIERLAYRFYAGSHIHIHHQRAGGRVEKGERTHDKPHDVTATRMSALINIRLYHPLAHHQP
jgi:hypothetical protein